MSTGSWWRSVGIGAAAFILGFGTLALIWLFARPLALLVLGIALAEALAPVVAWLNRWIPRLLAILLVYLLVLLFFIGIGWVVIPTVANQIQQAAGQIPALLDSLQNWLNNFGIVNGMDLLQRITDQITSVTTALLAVPFAILSSIFDILLVFVVSIYWLIEAPSLNHFVLSLFSDERRGRADEVLSSMGQAMGGYVRGIMIDAVIVAILTYVGLQLIGIRFALVLAILTGILEIIPFIGPIIAGAIMVLVALLQSATSALIVLIFVVVLQQIENHVLVPNIMRSQTDVSPLLVVIALFAGAAIGGLLGALVAVPLAAALRVFVREVLAPTIRRRTRTTNADQQAVEAQR